MNNSQQSQTRVPSAGRRRLFSSGRERALLVLLSAGALVRCDCSETQEFIPAATYNPDAVLDFGGVAVNQEKTLDIEVLSSGGAALVILAANRVPDNALTQSKFRVDVQQELLDGLTPGRTSSISITYRPCPDAWTDAGQLDPNFDLNNCPSAADQIQLNVLEDRTRAGSHEFTITGQPVQPPVLEIACPQGGMRCNDPNAELLTPCVSFQFGNVASGETPCEITFEIRNTRRNGQPTGPLNIERFEILTQNIDVAGPAMPIRVGQDVGFSIVDDNGNAIDVNPDAPLTVEIPEGAQEGSVRLKARFNGTERGIWVGQEARMTGIRVYNDDPDQRPVKTVSFSGTGSAPDIQVLPTLVNFGPVPQGTTRTATISLSNAGDSPLVITDMRFRTDTGQLFGIRTSAGTNTPTIPPLQAGNNKVDVFIDYTPQAGGQDADVLLIGSNDLNSNPVEIPVTGGAVPKIRVSPIGQLQFPLENPPPPPPVPPRDQDLLVSNVGFGDLVIQQLEIVGPDGTTTHSSVDDFSVTSPAGCETLPCQPNTTLCSPAQANCASSETTITVRYQNNDSSSIDLADLRITTNDPTDPTHIVTLSAQDIPCLFPTPIITVTSTGTTVGDTVIASAASSDAGGMPGGGATLTDYLWEWRFTPGAQPVFSSQGMSTTSFVPSTAGPHILSLTVTNDCGSMSQVPATENIPISPR